MKKNKSFERTIINEQANKQIELVISRSNKKHKYIAVRGEFGIYPALFFRKSKWVNDNVFREIIDFLLEGK